MNNDVFIRIEEARKSALNFLIAAVSLMVVGMLFFVGGGMLFNPVSSVFGFALFAAAIVVFLIYGKKVRRYSLLFKDTVVRSILSEVFTDLVFDPARGISKETVYATRMISRGDRYSSNDLISGRYRGVSFTQSDVHIEQSSTDSEGHTSYTTLFEGRWMIFGFNKNFSSETQVASKDFGAARHRNGIFTKKDDRLHKVELEDVNFNSRFKVYAQDEHEAFYLLTPQMMESIRSLHSFCRAPIMLMFYGGKLHVAVDSRHDAFEPKVTHRPDPVRVRAAVMADVSAITGFIDRMNIDNDIYGANNTR